MPKGKDKGKDKNKGKGKGKGKGKDKEGHDQDDDPRMFPGFKVKATVADHEVFLGLPVQALHMVQLLEQRSLIRVLSCR